MVGAFDLRGAGEDPGDEPREVSYQPDDDLPVAGDDGFAPAAGDRPYFGAPEHGLRASLEREGWRGDGETEFKVQWRWYFD